MQRDDTLMTNSQASKGNFVGSIQMILAMGAFASSDALVKFMDNAIPATQFLVVRSLIGLCILWLFCRVKNIELPVRILFERQIAARSVCEFIAATLMITSLTLVPFSNIAAIMQSTPLVVVAGAALFFSEKVGWRRITAIMAGLVGVMLVIQPGLSGFNNSAFLVVAAAFFAAARDLLTRTIDKQASGTLISFATLVWILPLAFIVSLFEGWAPMSLTNLGLTFGASVIILLGYSAIVAAMRTGEINYVTPFRYSALIFATAFGYFIFSEIPNSLSILGTLIIVAAGLYTFLRERKLAKINNRSTGK